MTNVYQGDLFQSYRPSMFNEVFDGYVDRKGMERILFRASLNAGNDSFGMLLGNMVFAGHIKHKERWASKDWMLKKDPALVYGIVASIDYAQDSPAKYVVLLFQSSDGMFKDGMVRIITAEDEREALTTMNDYIG